ncbi:MAG: ABC transporter substrate-binding protein [Bacteroidota bacterium]
MRATARRVSVFLALLLLLASLSGSLAAAAPKLHVYLHLPPANMNEAHVKQFFAKAGQAIDADIEVHYGKPDQSPALAAIFLKESGIPLDVALYTHPDMVYQGLLEPLDSYLAAEKEPIMDRYLTAVWKNSEWYFQGKLYALPTSRNHFLLVYNRDMFDAAGVPAPPSDWGKDPTWTWDKVASIAPKLTVDRNGDRKPEVYGFSGLGWPLIWPGFFGTDFVDENGKSLLRTEQLQKALEFFVDFANKPFYGGTNVGDWYPRGVFEGQGAMGLVGTWDYRAVVEKPYLDLAPSPMGTQHSTINFVDGMGIFKDSKSKDLGWKLLKYMASLENSAEFYMKGMGWIIPHKDAWKPLVDYYKSSFGEKTTLRHIMVMANAGNYGYIPRGFRILSWRMSNWTGFIEPPLFEKVLPREMSVEAWLTEADRLINNAVAEYYKKGGK